MVDNGPTVWMWSIGGSAGLNSSNSRPAVSGNATMMATATSSGANTITPIAEPRSSHRMASWPTTTSPRALPATRITSIMPPTRPRALVGKSSVW